MDRGQSLQLVVVVNFSYSVLVLVLLHLRIPVRLFRALYGSCCSHLVAGFARLLKEGLRSRPVATLECSGLAVSVVDVGARHA